MRSVTRLSSSLGAVGLALALGAATSHAGGFTTTRFGGEHGHAATDDPTASFYNPAGLAYGHGTRIYVEGLFAYRTVDYDRNVGAIDNPGAGTPADATDRNSGAATLANTIVSPFIGLATDLGLKGFGFGFSLAAPFGGQAKWDTVDRFAGDAAYPGALDSSARWASIEGQQRAVYFTTALGWRTPDGRFAFGGALNVVQSKIALVRARNADGSDDLSQPNGAVKEGRSLLEVDGLDVSVTAGVMWKPTPCSRIGVSYHSQPGFGEQTLEGELTNVFGAGSPATDKVELRQTLPDTIRVGGMWRALEKVVLHFAIDFQRWSVYKNQCIVTPGAAASACVANKDGLVADDPATTDVDETAPVIVNIPRAWKNTVGLRVGGSYEVSDALEVNGGLLYDSNAVPDGTMDPALMDMDKVIPQLGVRYTAGKLLFSATLGHVFYFSRETAARTADPDPKNRNPDMSGKFEQSISYLLFGVGASL
jgi:long-chain fatty acid transport protein